MARQGFAENLAMFRCVGKACKITVVFLKLSIIFTYLGLLFLGTFFIKARACFYKRLFSHWTLSSFYKTLAASWQKNTYNKTPFYTTPILDWICPRWNHHPISKASLAVVFGTPSLVHWREADRNVQRRSNWSGRENNGNSKGWNWSCSRNKCSR